MKIVGLRWFDKPNLELVYKVEKEPFEANCGQTADQSDIKSSKLEPFNSVHIYTKIVRTYWQHGKRFIGVPTKIQHIYLGKGPKIKKRESMVFDHTALTPSPLACGLFTQDFSDFH